VGGRGGRVVVLTAGERGGGRENASTKNGHAWNTSNCASSVSYTVTVNCHKKGSSFPPSRSRDLWRSFSDEHAVRLVEKWPLIP
jgi:hypothetical protein